MYRPTDPRARRGLPVGGAYYYGSSSRGSGGSGGCAARTASLLLLITLLLGALTLQKVLMCDVEEDAAAEREAALVASLKRLQGGTAARLTATAEHPQPQDALAASEKLRLERKIVEKELRAQRAHKEAAACQAQLSILAGGADAQNGAAAAIAASMKATAESERLRKAARGAEARAKAADERADRLSVALTAAQLQLRQLRSRLHASSDSTTGAAPVGHHASKQGNSSLLEAPAVTGVERHDEA